jgi:hypothetical protein
MSSHLYGASALSELEFRLLLTKYFPSRLFLRLIVGSMLSLCIERAVTSGWPRGLSSQIQNSWRGSILRSSTMVVAI